jgi:uncharacterized protein
MEFEWDPAKNETNLKKHGIEFATASLIWQNHRRDYNEIRFRAWGEVDGRVIAVAYTWRDAARRIILARIASSRERRLYEEEIAFHDRSPPD